MKVVIVGLGLIGGSLALSLKNKNFAKQIVGVDANEEHCNVALSRELVEKIDTLDSSLVNADLVVLAIPVNAILKVLPKVLNSIGDKTAVTDVGSTKGMIVQVVRSHSRTKQFVPSHPMAGTENSGPEAAIPNLFQGRTAVICDAQSLDPKCLKLIEQMYEALEMRLIYMDSVQHDRHAAFVSHLSHISSFV